MDLGQWSAFFSGVAFTTLLLIAGLGIGMIIGRRRGRKDVEDAVDLHEVAAMMDGLADWTNDVMDDVTRYNEVVDGVTRWLRRDAGGESEKLAKAVSLLSKIAHANDLLKQRLENAETRLHEQTHDLQTFMSEARTDPLTGLQNRRAFDDELIRRESEWRRHQAPFAALMVDIDHFKQINDRFGHAAGDEVLVGVAKRLKQALRTADTVARFGGEEFAILLSFAEIDSALLTAERIRLAIGQTPIDAGESRIPVTVSGGVAQIRPGEDGKSLLARADEALYAAKSAGRNAIWWHDHTRCQSFTAARLAGPSIPEEEAVVEPDDPIESSFYAACADLRRQLLEMAEDAKEAGVEP